MHTLPEYFTSVHIVIVFEALFMQECVKLLVLSLW